MYIFVLQVYANGTHSHFIDAQNTDKSNWMRFVNCAPTEMEQNLTAYQHHGLIYYRSHKPITAGSELLVWYGADYGKELGITRDDKAQTGPTGPKDKTRTGPKDKTRTGPKDKTRTGPTGPKNKTWTGPAKPKDKTWTGPARPEVKTQTGPAGPEVKTQTGSAGPEVKTQTAGPEGYYTAKTINGEGVYTNTVSLFITAIIQ
jgi:hypothetical protein